MKLSNIPAGVCALGIRVLGFVLTCIILLVTKNFRSTNEILKQFFAGAMTMMPVNKGDENAQLQQCEWKNYTEEQLEY